MEQESLVLRSQEPNSGTYPDPDLSVLGHYILFFKKLI
jgi:hypothetical protein